MENIESTKPNIFEYTDYRAYLKAAYDFEKQRSNFSYAQFAERAGLKARSFLRTVITGKRNLTADALSKFVVGLALDYEEGEAFKALVHFNQAADFKSRQHYWESFLKLRPKNQKRQRVADEYLYLARMAYPILLVLLRQNHVDKSTEALAKMSGLKIHEVEEGLKTLLQLGALKEAHSGEMIVTSEGFVTSNDTPSIARQTFHINMLEKAKHCVQLDPSEREFQSMMVPLNKEELLYLKQRIRAVVAEVDEKFGGKRPNSEKIYSLNINLIPITPDFIREEKKSVSQELGEDVETLEVVS
jgi:uncharacterized protein (TIGR02147 family)